jgi:hypothetical protein
MEFLSTDLIPHAHDIVCTLWRHQFSELGFHRFELREICPQHVADNHSFVGGLDGGGGPGSAKIC